MSNDAKCLIKLQYTAFNSVQSWNLETLGRVQETFHAISKSLLCLTNPQGFCSWEIFLSRR